MNEIVAFDQIGAGDGPSVGGKGLNLALLTRAGLPVPPGFCITCAAHREAVARSNGAPVAVPDGLRPALAGAYRALGGGIVAVRSSATAEDGELASFAGQQETILGVEGDEALAEAVARCWRSLDSDRARAYRRQQGIDDAGLAMGVVVQRLAPAEVAGVLFTRDPTDATRGALLIEAAWGLGEAVVSGRVTPDRYRLDRATGAVLDQQIGDKPTRLGPDGWQPVDEAERAAPCLDPARLSELAALAARIEDAYGSPRDVEWCWGGGQFWILQARPITTPDAFERDEHRRAEVAALRARAEPSGTVWARYNLSEVLPEPTPMTWAIVRRFMSGRGGYGLMFRDLGFDPDPIIDAEGFIDLVCGRPYVNLSREPKLYFRDFPYGHDFRALKANPGRALYPKPTLDPARATGRFWRRLPILMVQTVRASLRMKRQGRSHADRLRRVVFPRFAESIEAERRRDLAAVGSGELLDLLERAIVRTLEDFARESLRPSSFAALAIEALEAALTPALGADRAAEEVRGLLSGVRPEPEADLSTGLQALADGTLDRAGFLARFGHRGPREMELARPRWADAPETVPTVAATGPRAPLDDLATRLDRLADEAKLSPARRHALRSDWDRARDYLGLRETSKHYLMMGYAEIRRILVELGRRHKIGDAVFDLEPDELPALIAGEDMAGRIAARRRRRALALSLEVPPVLFSDDLDAIGRPAVVSGGLELRGTPVSGGVAEGEALVLDDPEGGAGADDGFILVCPSTDPAWGPLFLRARGLVMETGGILSHGAIVAREFGLPAVVGLPDVSRRIRTGQRLRVDGNTGAIRIFEDASG